MAFKGFHLMNRQALLKLADILGLQYISASPSWLKASCPFASKTHEKGTDYRPSFGIKIDKQSHFHCLAGETKIVTWEGILPISSLAGQTVKLLTSGGEWVEAPIRNYGRQRLYKITLQLNGVRRIEYATSQHRWFINQKNVLRERTTIELHRKHIL